MKLIRPRRHSQAPKINLLSAFNNLRQKSAVGQTRAVNTTRMLTNRNSRSAAKRQPGTDAQLAANRANSQLSTGPRSETGKRIASLNAVKTGLTGRTVLLPSDDAVAYQQHVQSFFEHHKPQSDREYEVVQSLA